MACNCSFTMTSFAWLFVVFATFLARSQGGSSLLEMPALLEQVACFGTIFSVACPPDSILAFESARYGRNDTALATRCGVPFTRHCDVDVHFLMNRACAGRRKCSVAVSATTFGDPCGYEEFLRIEYRCVPVSAVQSSCSTNPSSPSSISSSSYSSSSAAASTPLFSRGFISSPNYPDKYYMDAECRWRVRVQPRQTIRFTILDFELDIKRAGRCKDAVEIASASTAAALGVQSASTTVFFRDCGVLGRHTVDVNASVAVVRFVVDGSSLTQRGFFMYFEASGPGCDELSVSPDDVSVVYYYDVTRDAFRANASCRDRDRVFATVTPTGAQQLQQQQPQRMHDGGTISVYCTGTTWSAPVPSSCVVADVLPTSVDVPELLATETKSSAASGNLYFLSSTTSIIGFTLGILSAVLIVVLILIVAVYCFSKRRRRASSSSTTDRRQDAKWRVVVNNLNGGGRHCAPGNGGGGGQQTAGGNVCSSCAVHDDQYDCCQQQQQGTAGLMVRGCRVQPRPPPDVCSTTSSLRRSTLDRCKICAVSGYACPETEYNAWSCQQQQQPPHQGPNYTKLLQLDANDSAWVGGDANLYCCPGCVHEAQATSATAAAAVHGRSTGIASRRRSYIRQAAKNCQDDEECQILRPSTISTGLTSTAATGPSSATMRTKSCLDCRSPTSSLTRSAPDLLFTVSSALAGSPSGFGDGQPQQQRTILPRQSPGCGCEACCREAAAMRAMQHGACNGICCGCNCNEDSAANHNTAGSARTYLGEITNMPV